MMAPPMIKADTNELIRLLLDDADQPQQVQAARQLAIAILQWYITKYGKNPGQKPEERFVHSRRVDKSEDKSEELTKRSLALNYRELTDEYLTDSRICRHLGFRGSL